MDLVGGSYKLDAPDGPRGRARTAGRVDTRNSWHMLTFVAKCRYTVFGKQKTIDACVEGFRFLEAQGFEFREIGFSGNHVHFSANVPKRYSILEAEIMLKSRSSANVFARIPGFRRRYPRGSFWSGYEHHESIGRDMEQAAAYIRSQPEHHGLALPGVQKGVFDFTWHERRAGILRVRKVRTGTRRGSEPHGGVIGAESLYHGFIYQFQILFWWKYA